MARPLLRGSSAGRPGAFARPAALLAALLVSCSSGNAGGGSIEHDVEQALRRFETREFFLPTMFASGPETVRATLLESAEMELLLAHPDVASPRLLARLAEIRGHGQPETPIPYFLFFERTGDRRARAAILSWLEAEPDATPDELRSPWHPAPYALAALRTLAPEAGLAADDAALFAERRALRERAAFAR